MIAGFSNKVGVFCTDSLGEPLAVSFTLSNDEESVSFETDEQGYGTFSFTPIDGRPYFLSSDSPFEITLLENREGFQNGGAIIESPSPDKEDEDFDIDEYNEALEQYESEVTQWEDLERGENTCPFLSGYYIEAVTSSCLLMS